MKGIMFRSAAMCCGIALSGAAWAQEAAFEVPRLSRPYVKDFEAFKLAANEPGALVKQPGDAPSAAKNTDNVPPAFTGGNVHKYLGLATIVGAALTAITAPEGCESNCSSQTRETNGTHAHLAKATVAIAVATVITGMLVHGDDIHFADGLKDPDNLHAMLGVTGAALMAYAVNKSKNSAVPVNHAGIAELGALCMVAAIKITW